MLGQGILDVLPTETLDMVIQETQKCDRNNFCELRLVCKALNELVEPKAFSTVSIQFDMDESGKWRTIPDFLSSLASRTSPYVRWARELRVTQLVPNRYLKGTHHLMARFDPWQNSESEREMMFAYQNQWLVPAIESLVQVERVGFLVDAIQPYHDAVSASAKLPRLQNLGIIFPTTAPVDVPLEGFSNLSIVSFIGLTMKKHVIEGLKRLLARCPFITDLALTARIKPGTAEVDSVELVSLFEDSIQLSGTSVAVAGTHSTSTLPSTLKTLIISPRAFGMSPSCAPLLRALTSLSISDDSAHVPTSFWKALQDSGICLQDMKVGPLLQPIVDYLLSYSGLRYFKLDSSGRDPEDAENMIHQFFYSVLPMHQSSMKELAFQNTKPGSWVITKSYLDRVSLCKNIEYLNLVYHFPMEEDHGPPTISLADLFGKISDNLPRLQTLKLLHTRKHQTDLSSLTYSERRGFIRSISLLFALQITSHKSHFSARRQPQFILHAAGSAFASAPVGPLESGSRHYRFNQLDRDERLDGPVFSIDDEGFY